MTDNNNSTADLTLACLALRFFLGFQLFLSGVDKFLTNGHFAGMAAYKLNMTRIAEGIAGGCFLPLWMTKPYAFTLPWLLLLSGIAIILGIKNRIGLALGAAIYTSLGIGLILVREDIYILGIYLGLTAAALCLNKYNRFALLKD